MWRGLGEGGKNWDNKKQDRGGQHDGKGPGGTNEFGIQLQEEAALWEVQHGWRRSQGVLGLPLL